ncbi:type B 50S ribosomal protein L31 [Candidatus Saccharibacteria bacterium]|nr:type B 50S ribosomal protein L31 [Candidatus Saccharibacteria bacterium]
MKKEIHPQDYRFVVFEDLNNGFKILTRSTAKAEETTKWEDGNEYPLIKVHISSSSHPFFTGQEKLVDIEGRVDKFKARREAAEKAKAEALARAKSGSKKTSSKQNETQKMGRLVSNKK